jgi:GH24 family phage-related lysozyme (muramidase)
MTDFTQKVIERLDRFEDNRLQVYDDANGRVFVPGMVLHGNLSISRGYNLNSGISAKVSDAMTQDKIDSFYMTLLYIFPEYQFFSEARRLALLDVMYHMGPTRFRKFIKMIPAIRKGDWKLASIELLDSDYGRDSRFTERSHENSAMLLNG